MTGHRFTFSGKMEGRLNMQEGSVPTISNIQVNQTGELDIQKTADWIFRNDL